MLSSSITRQRVLQALQHHYKHCDIGNYDIDFVLQGQQALQNKPLRPTWQLLWLLAMCLQLHQGLHPQVQHPHPQQSSQHLQAHHLLHQQLIWGLFHPQDSPQGCHHPRVLPQ